MSLYLQRFRTDNPVYFSSIDYIMEIHTILMVMCIPNHAYNSLDVRYIVFSTITDFVSEVTLGHVVALALEYVVGLTLTVEQIVCIFWMNRANCDTITKLGI